MTTFWQKIARRADLLKRRYRYEIGWNKLGADDIEQRLRRDLRGRFKRQSFYTDLFDNWRTEAPNGLRAYHGEVVSLRPHAFERLLDRRIRLLNREFHYPKDVDWHREPFFGVDWPKKYVGAISDFLPGSDIVLYWQLNKMMFLMDASYAYRCTGEDRYAALWREWVRSWIHENPYLVGMNWRSPLELGTRLVAWSFGLRELGGTLEERDLERIIGSLVEQAEFLAGHFSAKEIPNNHLIGEAATLYAFAVLWPIFERSEAWKGKCEAVLQTELNRQLLPDGLDYENSCSYHAYVLDFYLLYLLAKSLSGDSPPGAVMERVGEMAGGLLRLVSSTGRIPQIGDDSIGEFFILKSPEEIESAGFDDAIGLLDIVKPDFAPHFEKKHWLSALAKTRIPRDVRFHFADAGISVFRSAASQLVCTAGPVHASEFAAGHLHDDSASFELEIDGAALFIDSGTYLYFHDAEVRTHFKGARAHNTLLINDECPMQSRERFDWVNVLRGEVPWFAGEGDCLGTCSLRTLSSAAGDFAHHRLILALGDEAWVIVDRLTERATRAGRSSGRGGGANSGAPVDETGAGDNLDGGHGHEAVMYFHSPLAQDAFEVRGSDRLGIRLPAARRASAGQDEGRAASTNRRELVLHGFSSSEYSRELITDRANKLTWYSPCYGELRYGTTIRVGVGLEHGLTVVHTLTGATASVQCEAVSGGDVTVRLQAPQMEAGRLRVSFDPLEIRWNDRPVAGRASV
jgi:hypothetical protein